MLNRKSRPNEEDEEREKLWTLEDDGTLRSYS